MRLAKAWSLAGLISLSGCGSSGTGYAPITGPQVCNTTSIINGTFDFGWTCWAQTATAPGTVPEYPIFSLKTSGICLPASQQGNPWASIEVPGRANGYISQQFIYHSTPTTVAFRTWGTLDPVTVTVGIVFPTGTQLGTETVLDTFTPPPVQSSATACSGLGPVTKTYSFAGYSPGSLIEVRLHVTSSGVNGATANFDDVSSSP